MNNKNEILNTSEESKTNAIESTENPLSNEIIIKNPNTQSSTHDTSTINQTPSPKKSNLALWAIIIILVIALAAIGSYMYIQNKGQSPSSIFIKGDTLYSVCQSLEVYEINEERDKEIKKLKTLTYGEKIVVGAESVITIGGQEYIHIETPNDPNSFVKINDYRQLATADVYDEYKSIFTSNALRTLPFYVQNFIHQIFIDNEYLSNNSYFFSKIEDRIKSTIVKGDFDGDNSLDYAFLLESNDFTTSILYLIGFTKIDGKQEGKIIYTKTIDGLPTLEFVKKNSKVFLENTTLEKSTYDGVMIKNEYEKHFLTYSSKNKVFQQYYQYTDEDMIHIKDEGQDYIDQTSTESSLSEEAQPAKSAAPKPSSSSGAAYPDDNADVSK